MVILNEKLEVFEESSRNEIRLCEQLITARASNLFGIFNIVESVRFVMNISWYAYQYQVRLFAVKWDVEGSRNAACWICNETFLFPPYPPVYFLSFAGAYAQALIKFNVYFCKSCSPKCDVMRYWSGSKFNEIPRDETQLVRGIGLNLSNHISYSRNRTADCGRSFPLGISIFAMQTMILPTFISDLSQGATLQISPVGNAFVPPHRIGDFNLQKYRSGGGGLDISSHRNEE